MDAETAYADLARTLGVQPAEGGGFGGGTLTTTGKIFAMLVGGRLVVKLPAARCAELVADGTGEVFTMGNGRRMREWVAIEVAHPARWAELAREARTFVDPG